jgi:hypothetical protein
MNIWIPLVSALVGALIGSLTSIITLLVQSRSESRRARAKLAVEAGVEEFKQAIAALQGSGRRHKIAPLNTYIYYNLRIIELIEKGRLNPKTLQKLNQEFAKLIQVIPDRIDVSQED